MVLGPILIVVAVVLVLPPLFLVSGMIVSALIGWFATDYVAETHAGSELIELNR